MRLARILSFGVFLFPFCMWAAEPARDTSRGDKMIAEYFRQETRKIADSCMTDIKSIDDWKSKRDSHRQELMRMLGLEPQPEKTELHATVTGGVEQEEFRVENLHFQSQPGLYVTANLYLPKKIEGRLPAILYVCGHGAVKKDGISYGNKVTYQHHGAWFARNGYVCLTIDSLQLGEIEGIHHGTHRFGMWWWLNRGYTPAGVEAWNCVRAIDYLQSRPEVDPERIGVTGRSGGGAYSWWIAAIDERIKCAVPVAGITDLENHVVDGCVEGHCDCMFMFNTERWDYAQVAALVAPRPLLIGNTDSDSIFPLDGVVRVFEKVRNIYTIYGARDKVALNITAGPHKDTQELQVHAFRWLNHHLRGDDSLVEKTAVKFFEPEQLRVFKELPKDERNTKIQESFVAVGESPTSLHDAAAWKAGRPKLLEQLKSATFRPWPTETESLNVAEICSATHDGLSLKAYDFTSQGPIRLRLYVVQQEGMTNPDLTVLNVLDDKSWEEFLATFRPGFEAQLRDEFLPDARPSDFESLKKLLSSNKWVMAYVAPRGVGPTAWDQSEKKQTQYQRRFYLLGQSLDGMRVWDVRRAIQAVRELKPISTCPLWLQSHGIMAGNALYASLFEPNIARLDLYDLPQNHRNGPYLFNVQKFLDMPIAVAMAAENSRVVVYQADDHGWDLTRELAGTLGWNPRQFQIRRPPNP